MTDRHVPMIFSDPAIASTDRSSPGPGIDAEAYAAGGRYLTTAREAEVGIVWRESGESANGGHYELASEPLDAMWPFVPWRPRPSAGQVEDERRFLEVQERVEGRKAGRVYPGDEDEREMG